jgi:hypothetical protein
MWLAVQTRKAIPRDRFVQALGAAQQGKVKDKPFYAASAKFGPAVFLFLHDRLVVAARDPGHLRAFVERGAPSRSGPLAPALRDATGALVVAAFKVPPGSRIGTRPNASGLDGALAGIRGGTFVLAARGDRVAYSVTLDDLPRPGLAQRPEGARPTGRPALAEQGTVDAEQLVGTVWAIVQQVRRGGAPGGPLRK